MKSFGQYYTLPARPPIATFKGLFQIQIQKHTLDKSCREYFTKKTTIPSFQKSKLTHVHMDPACFIAHLHTSCQLAWFSCGASHSLKQFSKMLKINFCKFEMMSYINEMPLFMPTARCPLTRTLEYICLGIFVALSQDVSLLASLLAPSY